jgi:hypothetical protein
MKPLPLTPEIAAIARRTNWFESPEQAISNPIRFVAYVMTYGVAADVVVLRKFMSDDELRAAISNAPPGIFDERSWAYWNLKFGRYPAPPMPERSIPGADHGAARELA